MNGNLAAMPPQAGHCYRLRVYYEDTDADGVVYYGNYLRFAERARTEALRDAGMPHSELQRAHGLSFMVRRIKVEYLRPARLDDMVTVTTRVAGVGFASALLAQDVRGEDGGVLVSLAVKLACVSRGTGKAARIPPGWLRGLRRMALISGADALPPEQEWVG
jgi:acyl-CoA thioester hydrolase